MVRSIPLPIALDSMLRFESSYADRESWHDALHLTLILASVEGSVQMPPDVG